MHKRKTGEPLGSPVIAQHVFFRRLTVPTSVYARARARARLRCGERVLISYAHVIAIAARCDADGIAAFNAVVYA